MRRPGPATAEVAAEFDVGLVIFRAHDVRQTKQALHMVAAIKGDAVPARVVRGLA